MYNILMDDLGKLGSQEWLKNGEERNKRLGQLGLSKSQNYFELSQEERQFLDMNDSERGYNYAEE